MQMGPANAANPARAQDTTSRLLLARANHLPAAQRELRPEADVAVGGRSP